MQYIFTLVQKIWLYLFISLSLFFVGLHFYQQTKFFQGTSRFEGRYIILTGVFQLAFWVWASLLWKRIVLLSSSTNVTLLQSFTQLATASIGKYLPGKIWGMLARGVQMKRHGVAMKDALLATFHEQFLLLHSSILLSGILVGLIFRQGWAIAVGILVGISLFLGNPLQRIGAYIFMLLWQRTGRSAPKLRPINMNTYDYVRMATYFILLWVLNGLILAGLYLTFLDTHLTVNMFMIIILANTIGITVGFFAIFAPGGIGVREAVSSTIMAFSMSLTDAMLLSALFRLWVVAMEMLSGVPVIYFSRSKLPLE